MCSRHLGNSWGGNDPLSNFFLPDLLVQYRHASGFFEAVIEDVARHGELWVARLNGLPVGLAAWLPPGVEAPASGVRAFVQFGLVAPVIARSPHRRLALKLMAEVPKHHLAEEHWYLALLATDPLHQGIGIGSALLAPILQRCDEEGLPVFLETQKEANLAYYARFGFVEHDHVDIDPECPRMWMMQRPANR